MFTVDTRVPVLDGTLTLAIKIWYPSSISKDSASSAKRRCCLAYPGWLDNVGSFENIAPLLCEGYDMVFAVIDPPGCGWSEHRVEQTVYNDFEEPPLVIDVADALGWQVFGLVGHSRGAAVCAYAAAMFPERVRFLISFEGGFGLTGTWLRDLREPLSPAKRMRIAREQFVKNRRREIKSFSSLTEAIEANAKNETFPKSLETARNIVLRHIRPHANGGYTFTHDVRTYGQQAQFICITEQHLRGFLSEIECPTLKIVGTPESKRSYPEFRQLFAERASYLRGLEEVVVPGGHHLHSDIAPEAAKAALEWLAKKDPYAVRAKL